MKNTSLTITLSLITLMACGGSSEDSTNTATSKSDLMADLSNTSWEKTCFPYQEVSTEESKVTWNISVKLRVDSSLKSTYKRTYFRPKDTTCTSAVFDTTEISRFEITKKVTTEEGIEAYALNETNIFNSNNTTLPPNYTLIYVNSEKLYFGQKSGDNLGETPETRHSSISLDSYYSQILN